MTNHIAALIDRLSFLSESNIDIISWGSPVISFGNLKKAKVATLGLNPSNREFVDTGGQELSGRSRRFHTLNSLGLTSWSEVKDSHLQAILNLCNEYFQINPYDAWFKKLDNIISGTNYSYYFPSNQACHLDLVPYATSAKWALLSTGQKKLLLELGGNFLAKLLYDSEVEVLVLNGKSVVDNFQTLCGIQFDCKLMPDWTLRRKSSDGVSGFAYTATINSMLDLEMKREILVLGYNHNLQSSFGVTNHVQQSIRKWITITTKQVLDGKG